MQQSRINPFKHAFEVVQNLTIPESDHFNSLSLQTGRAFFVPKACFGFVMLTTIKLNSEFRFTAVKIKDKPLYRMLATKTKTAKLLSPETAPKQMLGIRHVLPQRTSSFK
jgi:hypothetical protein